MLMSQALGGTVLQGAASRGRWAWLRCQGPVPLERVCGAAGSGRGASRRWDCRGAAVQGQHGRGQRLVVNTGWGAGWEGSIC